MKHLDRMAGAAEAWEGEWQALVGEARDVRAPLGLWGRIETKLVPKRRPLQLRDLLSAAAGFSLIALLLAQQERLSPTSQPDPATLVQRQAATLLLGELPSFDTTELTRFPEWQLIASLGTQSSTKESK